jgi:hypothetical protein
MVVFRKPRRLKMMEFPILSGLGSRSSGRVFSFFLRVWLLGILRRSRRGPAVIGRGPSGARRSRPRELREGSASLIPTDSSSTGRRPDFPPSRDRRARRSGHAGSTDDRRPAGAIPTAHEAVDRGGLPGEYPLYSYVESAACDRSITVFPRSPRSGTVDRPGVASSSRLFPKAR